MAWLSFSGARSRSAPLTALGHTRVRIYLRTHGCCCCCLSRYAIGVSARGARCKINTYTCTHGELLRGFLRERERAYTYKSLERGLIASCTRKRMAEGGGRGEAFFRASSGSSSGLECVFVDCELLKTSLWLLLCSSIRERRVLPPMRFCLRFVLARHRAAEMCVRKIVSLN